MKKEDVISRERSYLGLCEEELKSLKKKWFKTNSATKLIEFLEVYCNKKKEFIDDVSKVSP